jgi:hypothetical protein
MKLAVNECGACLVGASESMLDISAALREMNLLLTQWPAFAGLPQILDPLCRNGGLARDVRFLLPSLQKLTVLWAYRLRLYIRDYDMSDVVCLFHWC